MPIDKTLHSSRHDRDPKDLIREEIGSLEGYDLSGHQVLVAIYVRPGKTGGGLLRHDSELREDEYQGKVGLIIKMGPLAFTDLGPAWPDERVPQIGDWVGFRQMEGVSRAINGVMCKIFEAKQIRERLPNPDLIA